MKFGALLRTSAGGVPELQELFTAYKQLKKHLKRLPQKQDLAGGTNAISAADAEALGATEADFVAALSSDVTRFNDMFLEREEDAVIRLRSLEDEAVSFATIADLKEVYRRFVDFHGEMLLLVHWSILAYTGMVKILKKHHKRTGLLVRAPHLDNLAAQPFCSTELMSELVRKAEADIDVLRTRLAAVDIAPLASAAAQSDVLLQAARDKGGVVGAAGLLVLESDSGSAPSGDEASSDEISDAETARAGAAVAEGAAAAVLTSNGSGSAGAPAAPLSSRRKRRAPEAATGAVAAAAADGGPAESAGGASPPASRRRLGGGSAEDGSTAARAGVQPAAPAAAASLQQQPASSGSGSGNTGAARARQPPPTRQPAAVGGAAAAPILARSSVSGSTGMRPAAQAPTLQQQSPPPPPAQPQGAQQPRPARILAQTQAALGLWKELTETASTPSTVLPVRRPPLPVAMAASSVTTDQSAA